MCGGMEKVREKVVVAYLTLIFPAYSRERGMKKCKIDVCEASKCPARDTSRQ
jgi:hypothetical protein